MKKCKGIALCGVIVVVMVFNFTIFASAKNMTSNKLYNDGNIELGDDVEDVLKSVGFADFSVEEFCNISIKDSVIAVFDIFNGSLKKPFSCMFYIVGIIIISSVGAGFVQQNKSLSAYFDTVVVLIIVLYAFLNMSQCIKSSVAALYSTGILMKSLIPVTAGLVAVSGNPTLAVSYNAVMLYSTEIISAVCRDFLSPLLCCFASVSVCMSVNASNFNSDSVFNFFKKVVGVVLGLCGTVFTGILALKDILAVGADKIAVKSVKFVIGSTIPVIGSALSEGLSSVLASVSLMKNIYGTIGIIVIITLTLPAISELILWIFVFNVTEYTAQVLGLGGVAKALSSLRYVLSMLLSILLFVIYILIVSSAMIMLLGNK